MADCSAQLQAQVEQAISTGQSLYINGGGSKRSQLGRHCDAPELDVSGHRGIVDYRPGELVVTARAGTPIAELQACLQQQGQTLACDPPRYDGIATLGGSLASNLSGPARPFAGSLRDAVLGVQLINGRAELLNFGGQVMKNVAGYDVARLQAGAMGCLGLITQLSLKVLPLPQQEQTLCYELDQPQALEMMSRCAAQPYPLSGACWFEGRLYLRLAGDGAAVGGAARAWGGEPLAAEAAPWRQLRDMSLPFFSDAQTLWRLTLKPDAAPLDDSPAQLIDWGGAQRWLRGPQDAGDLQQRAAAAGGHACLFAGGDRRGEVRQPLDPVQQALQLRLKQAFDPAAVFNPGRLYSWM